MLMPSNRNLRRPQLKGIIQSRVHLNGSAIIEWNHGTADRQKRKQKISDQEMDQTREKMQGSNLTPL